MKWLDRRVLVVGVSVVCVIGCRGEGSPSLPSGGNDTGSSGSVGTSSSSAETSSSGDGTTTGTTGVTTQFDVAARGDAGVDTGCEKIDFLFVIDNSGSMVDDQTKLIDGFPGFIDEIQTTVQGQDHHIMVTTTDEICNAIKPCDQNNGCGGCDTFCQMMADMGCTGMCGGMICPDLEPIDECGATFGAGETRRPPPDNGLCGIAGGQRSIVDGQPDLADTFACIALVGDGSSGVESPIRSIEAATTELNGPGQCNDGFLRDDAILVVTVITDEDDEASPGDPGDWVQSIVASKAGNDEAVVALAIVDDSDMPNGLCAGGFAGSPAPRLRQWAESLPHGSWGSICAPDYGQLLHDAVGHIDAACDQFEG